jgi:hypothetical protein
MLDDPELQGDPVSVGRVLTPGERALQRLEVGDGEPMDAAGDRDVVDGGRGVREWIARTAPAAIGQR